MELARPPAPRCPAALVWEHRHGAQRTPASHYADQESPIGEVIGSQHEGFREAHHRKPREQRQIEIQESLIRGGVSKQQ